MSGFVFPYIEPERGVFLPWIMVRLGNKKAGTALSKPVVALIDSGAEVCFCSKDIAEYLGIDLSRARAQNFTTASNGTFTAYKVTDLKLYVCKRAYGCEFYVTDSLPPQLPIILGHKGFFDHHKVHFNFKKKEIELEVV
jgi:hypothetical protein